MLSADELTAMPEWSVIRNWTLDQIAVHTDGCINAETLQEKEFHKGCLITLREFLAMPRELFQTDNSAPTTEDEQTTGELLIANGRTESLY